MILTPTEELAEHFYETWRRGMMRAGVDVEEDWEESLERGWRAVAKESQKLSRKLVEFLNGSGWKKGKHEKTKKAKKRSTKK